MPPAEPNSSDWRQTFREADVDLELLRPADRRERGRRFEAILRSMFGEAGLEPRLSYRPKGEEIDGSIWLFGRTVLIEAKWTQNPQPASSLYQFRGKVDGKLAGTLGLFISMSGFSADAVDALVAGKELNLILFDGADVRAIVNNRIGLEDGLKMKFRAAGDSGTPYVPILTDRMIHQTPPTSMQHLVVTEGASDIRILHFLRQFLAPTAPPINFLPAGGPANISPMLQSVLTALGSPTRLAVVLDGDVQGGLQDKIRQTVADLSGSDLIESATVISVDPDLDQALGLVPNGADWPARRRMRRQNTEELQSLLDRTALDRRVSENPSLAALITELKYNG